MVTYVEYGIVDKPSRGRYVGWKFAVFVKWVDRSVDVYDRRMGIWNACAHYICLFIYLLWNEQSPELQKIR